MLEYQGMKKSLEEVLIELEEAKQAADDYRGNPQSATNTSGLISESEMAITALEERAALLRRQVASGCCSSFAYIISRSR